MATIEKTYTNFWAGISDDDFIGTDNSVSDIEGIEIRKNERYISASEAYVATSSVT